MVSYILQMQAYPLTLSSENNSLIHVTYYYREGKGAGPPFQVEEAEPLPFCAV